MNVAHMQDLVFDKDHCQSFLNKHGWQIDKPVGQDSSIRRYFRVTKNNRSAILMETVPDGSPYATPGHSLGDFVRIAKWLESVDLKAPEIYEEDQEHGYLLLEDLGDVCFRDAMRSDVDVSKFYETAADVLQHLSSVSCSLALPQYYDSHVHRRHRRVIDWFVPLARQAKNDDGLVEEYKNVWQGIEEQLPAAPQGFTHVDFHAQNLMWLPEEQGMKRCGILDFQGAMIGPQPYDLSNLLEDARNDIPAESKQKILSSLTDEQQARFRVLATQFHCRVIGQFIKQAAMDENPRYLPHIPRLQNYIAEGLKDPVLKPLHEFFDDLGVDFKTPVSLENIQGLKSFVREDAM